MVSEKFGGRQYHPPLTKEAQLTACQGQRQVDLVQGQSVRWQGHAIPRPRFPLCSTLWALVFRSTAEQVCRDKKQNSGLD